MFRSSHEKMEERLSTRMDSGFIELAKSLTNTIQDLVKQNTDAKILNLEPESAAHTRRHSSSSYVCGTCLAKIDFPRFNGDNVLGSINATIISRSIIPR